MQLETYIKENRLSFAEFAKTLGGCSGEAVRLWSAGRRMPEPEIAQRIVEVTEGAVSIQDLHDTRLAFLRSSASHEAA